MSDMRPLKRWPGYWITKDGQVYSSRNSKDGSLRPRTARANGTINLSRIDGRREQKISELIAETWGSTP